LFLTFFLSGWAFFEISNNMIPKLLTEKTQLHGARIVAVSKTHPLERIQEVYATGQRIFGENRVQELLTKAEALTSDIEWHFIGSLQTNKVKNIVPIVAMIHAVDSQRLLEEVEKQAAKVQRRIPCLLQFYIAQEDTKHGFLINEVIEMLDAHPPEQFPHIAFCGVMGMATYTENTAQITAEFQELKNIFESLKAKYFAQNADFKEISMGMSGDWELALEQGSTLVRVGSMIFGNR
jgi:PLP dependent protein